LAECDPLSFWQADPIATLKYVHPGEHFDAEVVADRDDVDARATRGDFEKQTVSVAWIAGDDRVAEGDVQAVGAGLRERRTQNAEARSDEEGSEERGSEE
jgi:hypothetical protein